MAYTPLVWKNSPDTSTPITAENLNRMEEGIQEALNKGSMSYLAYVSDSTNNNYYYEIYKYTISDANALILINSLTTPYYYYEVEGWAKCTSISEDSLTAYFQLPFSGVMTDVNDSSTLFYDNSGRWFSVPQTLYLGTIEEKALSGNEFHRAFRKRNNIMDTLVELHAEIWAKANTTTHNNITFTLEANVIPNTSTDYIFTAEDIGTLAMYFKIKLDQTKTRYYSE